MYNTIDLSYLLPYSLCYVEPDLPNFIPDLYYYSLCYVEPDQPNFVFVLHILGTKKEQYICTKTIYWYKFQY
jgi:hypothetical protein